MAIRGNPRCSLLGSSTARPPAHRADPGPFRSRRVRKASDLGHVSSDSRGLRQANRAVFRGFAVDLHAVGHACPATRQALSRSGSARSPEGNGAGRKRRGESALRVFLDGAESPSKLAPRAARGSRGPAPSRFQRGRGRPRPLSCFPHGDRGGPEDDPLEAAAAAGVRTER